MAAPTNAQDVLDQVARLRIVPIFSIDDASGATPLGDALAAGGLPLVEITFRTDAAELSIRTLARRGDLLVGAGTVLNPDTAKRAVDAGARFLVTPGFNPKTVRWALDNKVAIVPGTSTPTDLEMAVDHGVNVVKFFPAEALGGVKTLKVLAGPFGMMRFVPTGGIGAEQVESYLAFSKVAAVGGSWMATKELLAAKRFDEITRLTKEAVSRASKASGAAR
jgi:2-dehydro-3-deoxyphosphogluconate aldolase/(4S)-4-hydroxy-2-oxoglutarate aldolase